MVDTQKVGAFIAQCRKEHNWTQKELGEKRLRGFQIGIYLLGLVTIILGGIGFGIWGTHISWKIGSVPIKWILLAAALITFGVMAYFDRNLPGKITVVPLYGLSVLLKHLL